MPGHGRRLHSHLETEERFIDVDPELRRCRCCGTEYEYLGTEDSEQIDWEMLLRRILWRRLRYQRRCTCPAALAGPATVCAPRPPKVIPKGLFTAMFLARLAYEKYVLGRHSGKPPAGKVLEQFLPWTASPEDLRAWAHPPPSG